MKVLKSVGMFKLNEGNQAATGLYNVSHENGGLSLWFDKETKDELMNLDDKEFKAKSRELIKTI